MVKYGANSEFFRHFVEFLELWLCIVVHVFSLQVFKHGGLPWLVVVIPFFGDQPNLFQRFNILGIELKVEWRAFCFCFQCACHQQRYEEKRDQILFQYSECPWILDDRFWIWPWNLQFSKGLKPHSFDLVLPPYTRLLPDKISVIKSIKSEINSVNILLVEFQHD